MDNKQMLRITFGKLLVGNLAADASGQMSFIYAKSWLASELAFPISLSLPLAAKTYHEAAHNWFANLLPEERQRQRITKQLGIAETSDFALLRAIGGECAGALAVGETIDSPVFTHHLQAITDDDLERWIRNPSELPVVDAQRDMRLSIAGAQEKLPVICTNAGLFLPAGGSASTHLLKFPQRDFAQLPENEYFTTKLAAAFGLPTHTVHLRRVGKAYISLAQRYDRTMAEDGTVKRLHQEDFCQALGLPAWRKYEAEGGPSLAQCIQLAANEAPRPVQVIDRLLRWSIFNLVVGNCDAHAKNLSFLWQHDGTFTLAPFYDLVCTLAYPGLSSRLAQRIGGESDPGRIGLKQWQQLAQELQIKPKLLVKEVSETAARLIELVDPTIAAIRSEGIAFGKAADIKKVIVKQVRSIRNLL